MALGGTIRRSAMALIVIGAGGFAAMNPGAVKAFYENIYPSDPAKHEALELCFMQDHKFNRLDAGERDNCYRRMLQPLGELSASQVPADQPNANLIDLQRSAGQGHMPRNDIRRLEQNENALHSPR